MEDDLEIISRIPINLKTGDKLIWHYDKTSRYLVKSGYKLFMNSKISEVCSSENVMNEVWGNLWNLKIPTKVKIFCWQTINEILPTKLNLQKRRIDSSVVCPIWSTDVWNQPIILFRCNRAKSVWELTFRHVFLEENFNHSFAGRWLKINSTVSMKDLELIVVAC